MRICMVFLLSPLSPAECAGRVSVPAHVSCRTPTTLLPCQSTIQETTNRRPVVSMVGPPPSGPSVTDRDVLVHYRCVRSESEQQAAVVQSVRAFQKQKHLPGWWPSACCILTLLCHPMLHEPILTFFHMDNSSRAHCSDFARADHCVLAAEAISTVWPVYIMHMLCILVVQDCSVQLLLLLTAAAQLHGRMQCSDRLLHCPRCIHICCWLNWFAPTCTSLQLLPGQGCRACCNQVSPAAFAAGLAKYAELLLQAMAPQPQAAADHQRALRQPTAGGAAAADSRRTWQSQSTTCICLYCRSVSAAEPYR